MHDLAKGQLAARCLPVSVPFHDFFNLVRIVQTPALTVMLYESPNSPHRTIFTDGRDLPKDPNPTWLGYSIGRWRRYVRHHDRRFQYRAWLDSAGYPQTDRCGLPSECGGVTSATWTSRSPSMIRRRSPDPLRSKRSDCWPRISTSSRTPEIEQDLRRMTGDTGVRVSPQCSRPMRGPTNWHREFAVIATGDLLFVQDSTSRSFRRLSSPDEVHVHRDAHRLRVRQRRTGACDARDGAWHGRRSDGSPEGAWPALPWPGDVPGRRTCMFPSSPVLRAGGL